MGCSCTLVELDGTPFCPDSSSLRATVRGMYMLRLNLQSTFKRPKKNSSRSRFWPSLISTHCDCYRLYQSASLHLFVCRGGRVSNELTRQTNLECVPKTFKKYITTRASKACAVTPQYWEIIVRLTKRNCHKMEPFFTKPTLLIEANSHLPSLSLSLAHRCRFGRALLEKF